MTFVFVGAGISKLRHGGLAWITSETFGLLMIQANYPLVRQADAPMTDWGLWIAAHRWICRGLAASTLLVELGFPLALFSRRIRLLIVPAALAMQLGISIVMGPNFNVFVMTYLFWVPWDRVVDRIVLTVRGRRPAPAPAQPSGDLGAV